MPALGGFYGKNEVYIEKWLIIHKEFMDYTSSTAQGGGGSFRIGNL